MKLLYDHQIFVAQRFGGISRYYKELMHFDDSGVNSICISPDHFKYKSPTHRNRYLKKIIRSLKGKLGIGHNREINEIPKEVTAIISGGEFDVFHPTYYDPYFLEYLRKPFVLTVYDMIHEIFKEITLADTTTSHKRLLCERASHIIAISHKTKTDLVELFGIDTKKISVIHLASSFSATTPIQPVQKPAHVIDYILFTGQRAAYKNFYFTVIALSALLKVERSLHILCTGSAFSEDEKAFFKDCGVESKIHSMFCETDNELAWAYSNAKLFIFPSLYEGFGFPILEAFACSCPVVSSSGGSLPEVAGDAAVYFDPKNSQQLESSVQAVLYDDKLREDLIQKGRRQLSNFSWEKCRKETLDVYKQVAYSS